ncbi:MAG: hypothetical protein IJV43_00575 [Oscillospiraceae bacterium]|nr:hypothetical protein [Oscillospiraceae bacterium]
MKKQLLFFLLLAALLLAGCGSKPKHADALDLGDAVDYAVNDEPGVTMTLVDGTASANGATVLIVNETDKDIRSERDFFYSLQLRKNGKWYPLRYITEVSTTSEFQANPYPKGEPHEAAYVWTDYYGTLPAGAYRIVRAFWEPDDPDEPWDGRQFRLAAEFTVD